MENDLKTDKQTDRPMNGWEALSKIVENLAFAAVVLGILGLIYLLVK